jgi:hypothetical protein
MAPRQPMHKPANRFQRGWLPIGAVRTATAAALLCSGLLAATALASSHVAGAQPEESTITSATSGPTSGGPGLSPLPKGVWMAFEANPPSFVLRPLRRFAACVRRHGITGLPNPKVIDGKVVLMLPRGFTAKSPRLKKAQRACQKFLPQGPNTQRGTGTGPTTTRPGSG